MRSCSAAQGDIDTPTDGFADNASLFLPPTVFNRFAVTREINDGLLVPRFPRQRAWILIANYLFAQRAIFHDVSRKRSEP